MEHSISPMIEQIARSLQMQYTIFDVPTELIIFETEEREGVVRYIEHTIEEFGEDSIYDVLIVVKDEDGTSFINGDEIGEEFNKGVEDGNYDEPSMGYEEWKAKLP